MSIFLSWRDAWHRKKSDHVNNSSILSFAKAGAELQVLAGVPRLGSPPPFFLDGITVVCEYCCYLVILLSALIVSSNWKVNYAPSRW